MGDHAFSRMVPRGTPMHGLPKWGINERGEPNGTVEPTLSSSALAYCQCGHAFIGVREDGVMRELERHISESSAPKSDQETP